MVGDEGRHSAGGCNDSLNAKDNFRWKALSAARERVRATHSDLPQSAELESSVES